METIAHFLPGPLPSLKDAALRPFFEGTKRGELRFPKCRSCGSFTWYPQPLCRSCSAGDLEWVVIGGRGKVYTWTVVRFPFSPDFQNALPFVIALVEFDDAPGVRFVTNLIDVEPEKLRIGMDVAPVFHRSSEEVTMPVFKPVL